MSEIELPGEQPAVNSEKILQSRQLTDISGSKKGMHIFSKNHNFDSLGTALFITYSYSLSQVQRHGRMIMLLKLSLTNGEDMRAISRALLLRIRKFGK